MNLTVSRNRGRFAVLAACASPFLVGRALGGIDFDEANSSAKITHYAERDNAGTFSTKNVNPPPTSGSMPTPSTYQYSKTLLLNGGSSSASGSVGAVTNSQNVGFTFASGTGLTQSDPTGTSFSKAATLKFVLNGEWDVTAGGFGPTAYGYLAFTLGGVIPPGDSASVDINLTWKDGSNNNLRSAINQTLSFGPGDFPYSFSNSAKLNTGSVTGGSVKVSGTITFSALDPGATVDMHPLDFELSAAPPTFKFNDSSANLSNADTWIDEMGSGVSGTAFPDNPGDRAYIGPPRNGSGIGDLLLSQPTTLGMLDIDRPNVTISGSSNTTLTFNTEANNAVLFVRNTHNFTKLPTGTGIGTPISLLNNLEIINDSPNPITFSSPISGSGGIIKSGQGEAAGTAPNTFAGGITVTGGTLTAGGDGAFGNNNVTLNGGNVNINTPNPFGPGGGTIAVQSNSVANVNVGGGNVNYNVASFGAVSGGSAELSSLNVGNNFFPATNSMIVHKSFDPNPAINNPVGLGVTPKYIFGVASNFNGPTQSMVVGSTSATPWIGFGSDGEPHSFGGGAGQTLGIAGTAQIAALGAGLNIIAPINGTPSSVILKNGAGVVAFSSPTNGMTGLTDVQSGALAINGGWQGPITVEPGASLSGTGATTNSVAFVDSVSNPPTFNPGSISPVGSAAEVVANQTINGPGTFHTGSMLFTDHTHLLYDLNTPGIPGGPDNDLLVITGNLTLDGILDVNGGLEFTGGIYTLMTYSGTLTNNGLALGAFDLEDYPNAQIFNVPSAGGGGAIVIAVPEPCTSVLLVGGMAALFRRRAHRRRSTV